MSVEKVAQDETAQKRVTCANCGAVLQFYPVDVRTRHLSCMGESAGTFEYIECVQCGQEVDARPKRKRK